MHSAPQRKFAPGEENSILDNMVVNVFDIVFLYHLNRDPDPDPNIALLYTKKLNLYRS